MTTTMRVWRVKQPGPIGGHPLVMATESVPHTAVGRGTGMRPRLRVFRTDLHVTEGDLPVHRAHVTPGHEVVGEVVTVPEDAGRLGRGAEDLCPSSTYTGWDADGGYADFVTAPVDYVYRLQRGYADVELAPLLCARIIGYRALERVQLP